MATILAARRGSGRFICLLEAAIKRYAVPPGFAHRPTQASCSDFPGSNVYLETAATPGKETQDLESAGACDALYVIIERIYCSASSRERSGRYCRWLSVRQPDPGGTGRADWLFYQ